MLNSSYSEVEKQATESWAFEQAKIIVGLSDKWFRQSKISPNLTNVEDKDRTLYQRFDQIVQRHKEMKEAEKKENALEPLVLETKEQVEKLMRMIKIQQERMNAEDNGLSETTKSLSRANLLKTLDGKKL
jgi:hypothetical protein